MLKGILTFCLLLALTAGAQAQTAYAKTTYTKSLCGKSEYTCYRVKKGDSWSKLFPNPRYREIIRRLNRINVNLRRGMLIAIPKKNNLSNFDISPFPLRTEPSGRRLIIISMRLQAFGAYDKYGYLIHWGPISGGKGWCPDVNRRCNTPRGNFFVIRKGSAKCASSKYPINEGGAPMPYCMFFYGGYAMHASDLPGYHASHGCVRMFYEDAKWLNKHFVKTGRNGTKVTIRSYL
jgi:L,D-transpeptidase ErfK/SrfK